MLFIPLDICHIIAEYVIALKLLDWININKLNWGLLSINPNAADLLEKNPDKISWSRLSGNSAAVSLFEKNLNKIDWYWLSANPDKIDWDWLSRNPAAIHLLEANPDKINWFYLSLNPAAIHLLEANPVCYANDSLPRFLRNRRRSQGFERGWNPLHPDKIDWCALSRNPATIPMDQKK